MAVSITHTTQSTVTDELEPGIIGPNDWNEAHTISGTLDAAQMPALTGDVTTSAGSVATTLATVNATTGTFGSATQVAQVTVNAKGLTTAAANVTVTPAASSITGAGDLTKADDTNVTLTLGGTATGALLKAVSITAGWTGTLAAGRLNANVVQAITNDTNVTGSIATQTLTLGWTGQLAVTRGGTGLSTTTQGDILYADAANSLAKLAKSAASTRYLSNTGTSNNPAWAQVALTTGVTGTLPEGNGGTNQSTYARGDLLYASASNTLSKLAIGSAKKVLKSDGTDVAWGLGAGNASFTASKTGGAQSISAGTQTKVTMTNEVSDNGSFYDSANSKWTPPAGTVAIVASIRYTGGSLADQDGLITAIFKNGSELIRASGRASGTGHQGPFVMAIDTANGSDYYEVYGYCDHATTVDDGFAAFQGSLIP